ncbi:MAG TPA: sigma-70 family RNA polymerase sigma factor [Candidatus Binatia bacterium]|nr:sigma-70 family RNA polymerase sigma factor [Candidatus Binatia bacterium]
MAGSNVIPLRRRAPADAPPDLARLAQRAAVSAGDLRVLVETLEAEPRLRALATRLARGLAVHGPEDLLQNTLERVVRGLASYRATGDFLGWVMRIMRNAHVEIVRREARARTRALGGGVWVESDDGESDDPADALGERQVRERVLDAWRHTSHDSDVRLFWDRVYVGLSVEQLMRRTGRPRSTVYLMLQRGGRKLATELRRLLGDRTEGS